MNWQTGDAKGFLGHAHKVLEFDSSEVVLAVMHAWNTGFEGGPVFGPDSPHVGWVKMLEGSYRIKKIIEEILPPVITACRDAGIKIVHIAGDSYARRYPQYLALEKEVGPGPPPLDGSPNTDWGEEAMEDTYGPDIIQRKSAKQELLDIAPPVRPAPTDFVVASPHQFTYLLRKLRAWNIIYTGFMANMCLVVSPCGLVDMRRLGYRTILLRDCTTASENRESVATLRATEEAIRTYEAFPASYTMLSQGLIAATKVSSSESTRKVAHSR
ncbi:MAG: isochorismatase family protein [Phycisphaeraceae bacterium]|nr:isochorismatase family protein [Phycisphaeraceae bacterium]